MRGRLSDYERGQVSCFLYELYLEEGKSLDEETCASEGWIVYLEGRQKYRYDIGDVDYWEYVRINVIKRFKELKNIRNEKIRLESRLSLNRTYGESKEEIGAVLFRKVGDFTNTVALWDYVNRLGELKSNILRLLYRGEEDYNIIKILKLPEEDYYELKIGKGQTTRLSLNPFLVHT